MTSVAVDLPAIPEDGTRIVACGGLGEIGRNMTVFQHEHGSIIVDVGVMFPSELEPGVDLILPDFSILDRLGTQPTHVLLTHGHEDHIGGIPYLVRKFPEIVIVGSRLTLAFVRPKLQEHGLRAATTEVSAGDCGLYGGFSVEFLAVAHSVPDGLAIAIEYKDTTILHTGDFKLDDDPLDGRKTDLAGFERIETRGISLLLSDSTNADVKSGLRTERSLLPTFTELFGGTEGRVIFACFASNVHRVQQAINAALDTGRQFAFLGRSMIRNMSIAHELGYLTFPATAALTLDAAIAAPPEDVVLISTGSQGEPMSALARMARHDHRIKPREQDLVILSARLIPGNEASIFRVVNDLNRQGAKVLHTENASIHATGHAPAPDLARVLQITAPEYVVPVHGEWRHLRAHASLALALGLKPAAIVLIENGDVLDFSKNEASVVGSLEYRETYVEGGAVGTVEQRTLNERLRLATDGQLTIALALDAVSGALLGLPRISSRGLPDGRLDYEDIIEVVTATIDRSTPPHESPVLETSIRSDVRRWLRRHHRVDPYIEVSVIPFFASRQED